MVRSILATVALFLVLVSSTGAFSPLPNSLSSASTSSSTAVFFFGGIKATNDKKSNKKTAAKGKAPKEEKPKKTPMIMMFGKPQYDWVKNREIKPGENTKRMNWLYKPEDKK